MEELAARLDDRFKLLTVGHRTALPRHRTLRATLDWSYELLPEHERVVLRRLAVFAGNFTLESASAVAASIEIPVLDVVDYVVNLVTKSLVTAEVGSAIAQYRLLDTTRAYALEKLGESGEFDRFARRHAEHHRDLLERAETESETLPRALWLATYGRRLDNVRAALDWAFSPRGDAELGVALTVAAVPLWFQLSLIAECCGRVEQALCSRAQGADRGRRLDMVLLWAHATALLYTKGPGEQLSAAWTESLEIAESLDDIDYQLRALWGLWVYRLNSGEYRTALDLAQRFSNVAASKADSTDTLVGDRLMGLSLHFLGDQTSARRHFERMLGLYFPRAPRWDLVRFQGDQRVMAKSTLAHILWLQGFPDEAMQTAQSTVEDTQAIDHVISLCNALSHAACPIALQNGDLARAKRFVEMLFSHSAGVSWTLWHLWARCFEGVLLVKLGDVRTALQRLPAALDELRERRLVGLPYTGFLGDLAEGLGRAGRAAEGLVVVDGALERSERNEEGWCTAELLRIKGELLLREDASNAAPMAEELFRQGLDWASRQGALSWELRCATSLARLWQEQRRPLQAYELLAPIYGRFTEGFDTADLIAAKSLLERQQ